MKIEAGSLNVSLFVYFVDDVVAPQVLGVFGPGPQDTGILERELPRLTEQLAGSFAQIASQTDVPNPPHSRWQRGQRPDTISAAWLAFGPESPTARRRIRLCPEDPDMGKMEDLCWGALLFF